MYHHAWLGFLPKTGGSTISLGTRDAIRTRNILATPCRRRFSNFTKIIHTVNIYRTPGSVRVRFIYPRRLQLAGRRTVENRFRLVRDWKCFSNTRSMFWNDKFWFRVSRRVCLSRVFPSRSKKSFLETLKARALCGLTVQKKRCRSRL